MYFDNLGDIKNYADEIICFYSKNDPYVKYEVEKEGNRLINYVVDLLENCPNDVRDYIAHNSIVNYFNEDKNSKDHINTGNHNESNNASNTESNTDNNNENNTEINTESNNESNTENNAQDTN